MVSQSQVSDTDHLYHLRMHECRTGFTLGIVEALSREVLRRPLLSAAEDGAATLPSCYVRLGNASGCLGK